MPKCEIKRALVSVSDKTGLVDFCRKLAGEFGVELISTGGTAKALREAGLTVTDVSAVTGFPEMLDGRVKTLHPRIHAGILADRSNPQHIRQLKEQGIEPIDLVLVNLYPFEKTVAQEGCTFPEAIEQIDIGGPTLLRAAAKNCEHGPAVLADVAADGAAVLAALRRTGQIGPDLRRRLAGTVWRIIAQYDAAIKTYWPQETAGGAAPKATGQLVDELKNMIQQISCGNLLRYGENSHQQGLLLPLKKETYPAGIAQAKVVQGEMSYNNFVDADAAYGLVQELAESLSLRTQNSELKTTSVAVIVKHTNACGVAIADTPAKAYELAYLGDPISAAGGVLCMNFPVTRAIAEMVMNSYPKWGKAAGAGFFKLDVWIAPQFEQEALKLITTPTEKRKWGAQVRILELPIPTSPDRKGGVQTDSAGLSWTPPLRSGLVVKSISGGLLVQTADTLGLNETDWKVVTTHQPTPAQWADLRFAWLVCKHAKSNAITIARDGQMLGSGVGQTSRVMSSRLAVMLAHEYRHAGKLSGSVAASDAFFPVPDGPQKLIEAGVKAIIQPGGGNRDEETRALCEKHGVALVLTGTRHFKH